MARILFAVVAALCALAAVSAGPAYRPESEDVQLSGADLRVLQVLQKELIHNPEFRRKFVNASDILEKIEEALAFIEGKIEDMSESVQGTLTGILAGIESAAIDLAGKWNSTLQTWVDKANAAGINVQECLDEQDSLIELANAFRSEAQQCIAKPIAEVGAELDKLKALAPAIQPIIEKVMNKIVECNGQGNILSATLCLTASMPTYNVEVAALVTKAVWQSSKAATKAAAIGPLATLCTSRATAGKAAEASIIVNAAVKCIKAKLNKNF